MAKRKAKCDSPTGWLDDLKAKIKKWSTTEVPNPFPQNEFPTALSERRKRVQEKDPTGTSGGAITPTTGGIDKPETMPDKKPDKKPPIKK